MKKYISFLALILFGTGLFAQTDVGQCFIGLTLGPSFPVSDFGDNSLNNENPGFAKTGYSDNLLNFGFRLWKCFGVSASVIYSQYNVYTNTADWWMIVGFTAGPMLTIPVTDKLFFDTKVNLGLVGASYLLDGYEYQENAGKGLGFDLRASFRYNLFKRWCLIAECGSLTSNQKFGDDRRRKIQNLNLGFGVAYRF